MKIQTGKHTVDRRAPREIGCKVGLRRKSHELMIGDRNRQINVAARLQPNSTLHP